jgi:diguanylate cyclase (GGDEF)-like protein
MSDNQVLHLISNETKSSINQMSIVTPSVYASVFAQFAKEHDKIIEDEKEFSVNLLKMECSNLTNLQTDASKSAKQLTDNTEKAIQAIKTKDEVGLAEVLKETQSLKEEIEKLKELIYRDELTRVYNRKWLNDNFVEEDSNKLTKSGTLAIIDLNYFKQVNDTHGHILGDKVLIFIANQLRQTRFDVVRYGGDEFIVMFDHTKTPKHAIDSLNRIREDVISKKLKAKDAKFTVSFSFGAVKFTKGDDLSSIIELADKNMYDDKIAIKKRVTSI